MRYDTNNKYDNCEFDFIETYARIDIKNVGLSDKSLHDISNTKCKDNECVEYLTISVIDTTLNDYFKHNCRKIISKSMRHDKLW